MADEYRLFVQMTTSHSCVPHCDQEGAGTQDAHAGEITTYR